MAKSNGFGMVTALKIGQSNATKSLSKERCSETIMETTRSRVDCIVQTATHMNMWHRKLCAVRNKSHSIAYSINTFICGWLRCYHPYEFITAYLNNVVTQEDIANATGLAKEYNITVMSPRYGLATDVYSFDKDAHAITKGLASVKYMNPQVSIDLYRLSHEHMNDCSFVDVLTTMATNHIKINSRQLDILIKIGYFEKYGNSNQLSAELDVFNQLGGGTIRSINSDRIPPCLENVDIGAYCSNTRKDGTAGKVWTVNNGRGLLTAAISALPEQPEPTLKERLEWSREFLGYVDVATHKPEDRRKVLINKVTPLVGKFSPNPWSYRVDVTGVQTGHCAVLYIRSNIYNKCGKLSMNDVIECEGLVQDKKGYWQLLGYHY